MTGGASVTDLALGAAITVIAGLAVGWLCKRVGRWFARAIGRTFAETVSEVVAPDLSRLGVRLGQSIDELKEANSREHRQTGERIAQVDARLGELVERVAHLEHNADRRRRGDLPEL